MNYVNDFAAWLNREMARTGLGNNELARKAGMSAALVSLVANGKQVPSERFCVRIAPVLGYKPEDVLREAGKYPGKRMGHRQAVIRITELAAQLEDDRGLLIIEQALREMIRQQDTPNEAKVETGGGG